MSARERVLRHEIMLEESIFEIESADDRRRPGDRLRRLWRLLPFSATGRDGEPELPNREETGPKGSSMPAQTGHRFTLPFTLDAGDVAIRAIVELSNIRRHHPGDEAT